MSRRTKTAATAIAAMAWLGGCSVGPNFHAPAPPSDAGGYSPGAMPAQTASAKIAGGEAQRIVPGADLPAQWWTLFQSPGLNALIANALARNTDLKAAQAGLRVAMENYYSQRAAFLPTVSAGASASRNENAVQPSPYLSSGQLLYNLYQGQLNASWTLDVFGVNRRVTEAFKAEADAQRFQLESTQLALTANLAAAAIQEAGLREQVAATQDIVRAAKETVDIFRKQNSLGQVAVADVAAQETAYAQLAQTLPPLEKQLAQQRDLLAALTGRLPSEAVPQTFWLSSFHLPTEVPLSLPSKLVEQRPDIRIAEANLHAACAEVGVAIANMLPTITLSANPGTLGTSVQQLFGTGSGFWNVGAGVTQPLFQGGALLHKTKAAQAAYEQAADQYRSTVITAFQNVADSLHALESDADSLAAAVTAEQAASTSYAIARKQLDLGSISYLGLLTAEQAYQQARIALIQAQAARLSDTAALLQALGGGWWNR